MNILAILSMVETEGPLAIEIGGEIVTDAKKWLASPDGKATMLFFQGLEKVFMTSITPGQAAVIEPVSTRKPTGIV